MGLVKPVLFCVIFGLALCKEPMPVTHKGYHNLVGIPLAQKIKDFEDQLFGVQIVNGSRSANPELDVKIVGGSIAAVNAHPYLAGLLINFQNIAGQSACGASLISPSRLVTAAHCWRDGWNIASMFTVVLGSQYLFYGGTRIATSTVVLHPEFNEYVSAIRNDIAMIYLPTNVAYSNSIQAIALPSGTQLAETFENEWTIASGFGLTSDSAQLTTNTMASEVNLPVMNLAQCQLYYGSSTVLASNLCTNGAGGVGICGGDSGGPLIVWRNGQRILIGVSSFVANLGCQLGYPSAFARITSFYSFIIQHM